ncbi:MAG: hypothetical protein JWM09_205 [Francisellaceae bacterium]|nr:hypothetical protein [Francisellaceae bacterium]
MMRDVTMQDICTANSNTPNFITRYNDFIHELNIQTLNNIDLGFIENFLNQSFNNWWEESGFNNYVEWLCDPAKAVFLESNHLSCLAKALGIRLEIYYCNNRVNANPKPFAVISSNGEPIQTILQSNKLGDEQSEFVHKILNKKGGHWETLIEDSAKAYKHNFNHSENNNSVDIFSLPLRDWWHIQSPLSNSRVEVPRTPQLLFLQANTLMNQILDSKNDVLLKKFDNYFKQSQIAIQNNNANAINLIAKKIQVLF